jgi:hypothetical protein
VTDGTHARLQPTELWLWDDVAKRMRRQREWRMKKKQYRNVISRRTESIRDSLREMRREIRSCSFNHCFRRRRCVELSAIWCSGCGIDVDAICVFCMRETERERD